VKTFTARATRWAKGWEIEVDVDPLPGRGPTMTQCQGTADAYGMAADLIATLTGEPVDSFAVEMTFRFEPGQRRPEWNGLRTSWLPRWVPRWQRLV